MRLLTVATLAALACSVSGAFRGDFARIFNTWNPSEDVRQVDSFDHLTQSLYSQVHEEEHSRRKRNSVETAKFASGNAITGGCNRPGYTGQYCEFPICESLNPTPNPEQFQRENGYVVDLTDLGNCTRPHKIIVDDTMYDIRIEVQSLENVSPQLIIYDENGNAGTPNWIVEEDDRYVAQFNVLPPGAYNVQPTAASIDSRCMLTTTAQTVLTISGGFQTDERDRNDFPNDNAAAHQFNSILLTMYGARAPASLKTVSVVGPDNYLLRPRQLDKRYGCQYEFYFDSFFCYSKGSYALIAEGVDFFGNLFRRVAPFECLYQPDPTTPSVAPTTPIPKNPTSCASRGMLVKDFGKTSCVCQDHWSGYDCSQPLCVNGGTRIEGKCFCPVGYEGVHCEQVKCEPNSNHGFGVDRPTVVFVVRVRSIQNNIMLQVQQAIDQVVANLQFDPTYLTRFAFVSFNFHKVKKVKHYDSIEAFDKDFIELASSTDNLGKCDDDVFGAVATALTDLPLTEGSTIYVVTDAMDEGLEDYSEQILQMNSFKRATINFVYVPPPDFYGCITDISDPGFRAFDNIANRFGGLAWIVEDREKVYDVLYGHMNSILYKPQLMLSLDRDECSKGLGKVIQLENTAETLVFVSRGLNFNLDMKSPDEKAVNPTTVVKQGTFTVMRWATPLAGAYMITASTEAPSSACSLRAYQASAQQLSSYVQTEVAWAISTDVDTDAIMNQPNAGMDNHPVFHVDNFGEDFDHAFAFLNMYAVRGGVEEEVYASNGFYRGGCTYQFYFPSFRCRPNENLHYEFNLRNEQGFYVQRAGVMTCFNYIPTPSPPSECLNGGVAYKEKCLCLAHYDGDYCQNLICENGGTPVFGVCQCATGWTGPYCTYPQCPESGPLPSYGYHVDMVFLVEVTPKGVTQIQYLLKSLPEVIRDVGSQHVDWIDRLVLIGYNSEGVVGMVDSPMSNTKKFFEVLSAWSRSQPPEDFDCFVQVWQAIDMLLNDRKDGNTKRELPIRSIINIFEASIPSVPYFDHNGALIYSTSEALLERKAIVNVFQTRDWDVEAGFPCGGSDKEFLYLEKVARRGDGSIFSLGYDDIAKAIRMIPTLFSSSIVYKYHNEDCARQVNVYFPVDAYTQTITAIVLGSKAAVQLRRREEGVPFAYEWTPVPDTMRVDILDDDLNVIVEYRNPCDNGWDAVSQYCMYYSRLVAKTWDDANALCQSMGAFMADDMTDDKNRWLNQVLGQKQAWLGLVLIDGKWVFLHDNGNTMPPPPHHNKWITGEAPTDPSEPCAYFYNGLWYPMICSREYVVVCQKHMHTQSNLPSSLTDDDLTPGHYYLVVQTDFLAENVGCEVEIHVQSALNVEFGFVDGLRRDNPHPIANVDSNDNLLIASVSMDQTKAQNTILEHVQLRSADPYSILLEAATFSERIGCSYEFVSQPLSCDLTNGSDFSVVLIGEDDTGNPFQRYTTSLCSKWYDCENGGVYSNGQCLCADYFTGDSCETPLCQNGGKLIPSGDNCTCPTGYSGDACQFVQCDKNSHAVLSDDDKAFVLVIEKSKNTADAIQQIGLYFDKLVQKMWDRHAGWINKYMVTTFTLDGTIEELDVYYDPDQFSQYLLALSEEAVKLPGSCQMPIWKALDRLFDSPLANYLPGSEILLVSAASPSDADLASIHATMEKFDIQTPIVDFYRVETADCSLNDWKEDLGDFSDFLTTTGGIVFRAQPELLGQSIMQFVPTRYNPMRLSYSDKTNCRNNNIYVQVDTGIFEVYVLVGGPGATMEAFAPIKDNTIYTVRLWNSDEQSLWALVLDYPGIYRFKINSDSPECFPTIYGGGPSVNEADGFHPAQVFSGFIQHYNNLDAPRPYAVYGAVNYPVFSIYELPGLQQPTETLYTARMTRRSIDGKAEESYTSDVDQRDGCSYSYVGKAFTCEQENDVITLSVSGVDNYNQPFTRQMTTYCKTDGTAKKKLFSNTTGV